MAAMANLLMTAYIVFDIGGGKFSKHLSNHLQQSQSSYHMITRLYIKDCWVL